MKNSYIFVLLTAIIGYQTAWADFFNAASSGTIFKEALVYPKDTPYGVEVVNKDKNSIWVVVKEGDKLYDTVEIPGATGGLLGKTPTYRWDVLDINKPIFIGVYLTKPAGKVSSTTTGVLGFGQQTFNPRPDQFYKFTPGKTIYLTWDEKKQFRPETGPLGGKFSKTDSNLSLSKNVKADDIQLVVGAAAQPKG